MARLLSSLPVGAKVVDKDTKYNGVPITWVVAGHDHYAQGQTVIISEKIITIKPFDAKEPKNTVGGTMTLGNNRYSYSNVRTWLNSNQTNWYVPQHVNDEPPTADKVKYNAYDTEPGFLTNVSANLYKYITRTQLTVALNKHNRGNSEVITDEVFLLSYPEVGYPKENNVTEGELLPLFADANNLKAYPTKEAVSKSNFSDANLSESKTWSWLLRTPYYDNATYVRAAPGTDDAFQGKYGVRPSLNIKSNAVVADSPNTNGEYEIMSPHIVPGDKTNLGNVSDKLSILKYTPKLYEIGTTVTEKINGVVVGTKTIVNDTEYTVSATTAQWNAVKYGKYIDTLGNKNVVTLEVSTGEIYTYPFTKTLPTTAKTNDVLVAVNDMSNTAMASHKKKLVDAIGSKATVGGTGTLEDIAKAIESMSDEKMASGSFTTDSSYKSSVRGLWFEPKGIIYSSPTTANRGVYFKKDFSQVVNFYQPIALGRNSSGSNGDTIMQTFADGFDITIVGYTGLCNYVVFG